MQQDYLFISNNYSEIFSIKIDTIDHDLFKSSFKNVIQKIIDNNNFSNNNFKIINLYNSSDKNYKINITSNNHTQLGGNIIQADQRPISYISSNNQSCKKFTNLQLDTIDNIKESINKYKHSGHHVTIEDFFDQKFRKTWNELKLYINKLVTNNDELNIKNIKKLYYKLLDNNKYFNKNQLDIMFINLLLSNSG
jgi:hypothetical protein